MALEWSPAVQSTADSTPARHRRSAQVFASGCLATALLALTSAATWSALATNNAARVSHRDSSLAYAYSAARFAVGAEESLERKYRLDPSPEVRAQHNAVEAAVNSAMGVVTRNGTAQDRAVAADIVRSNDRYLQASDEQFAALDKHDLVAAVAIDNNVTDPAFHTMQEIVYSQADRHITIATTADRRLLHIEALAVWATSLTVGVAALLIGLFARVRRRFNRDRDAQAATYAHDANHDGLTGLPNRTYFAELLGQQLENARQHGGSVGVILLDLDRFKEVNDTLGHHYGDLLLQQIGPRLRGVLREGEVMARLGGDEFALLVPTRSIGAEAGVERVTVARRILAALQQPFLVHEVSLAVEASVGIAVSPEHGDTGEVLLQRADIAMYLAKANGEDVAVYESGLDEYHPRKLALLVQLRSALERDELVLHYQPLVHISTGQVRGAEALVRWAHPEEGLVPPSEFIPLAEGSGLIHQLTRYVLLAACLQAKLWEQSGLPLVISVNISARCLMDTTLPGAVAASLEAAGLPARLLKLEITESAIIADPVRTQSVISRLHWLGVGLSVDDFGTGYTSLAYLRDLPVQELKIDRSFVGTMLTKHKDAVIVRTGVELAERLGLDSVAEGIEDAETLAALAALGCTIAQGYHIGRPMPADLFAVWLAHRMASHPTEPVLR
jgi:diguanylate cyclase